MLLNNWKKLENEIIEWHAKTFPDATLEGQLIKLEEEINEYINSETREEKIKESADIYIVLCGLKRWDSYIGKFIIQQWFSGADDLYNAVVEKMNKNKARIWAKTVEGSYHHTNKE